MADAPARRVRRSAARGGNAPPRLQVFLARSGVASRRASERLIASGRVAVNGEPVTAQGRTVAPGDCVTVDGRVVAMQSCAVYLALHKPVGYLCSNADPRGRRLARDLLPSTEGRTFHVGRLDLASSGLILFTNDGQFSVRATHPRYGVEKEYEVTTDRRVPAAVLERYRRGWRIDGATYTLTGYSRHPGTRVALTLTEGRNREIRRVLGHAGYVVRGLVRVRIGPLTLAGIASGTWRRLDRHEVAWFLKRRPCTPQEAPRWPQEAPR